MKPKKVTKFVSHKEHEEHEEHQDFIVYASGGRATQWFRYASGGRVIYGFSTFFNQVITIKL